MSESRFSEALQPISENIERLQMTHTHAPYVLSVCLDDAWVYEKRRAFLAARDFRRLREGCFDSICFAGRGTSFFGNLAARTARESGIDVLNAATRGSVLDRCITKWFDGVRYGVLGG